MIRQTHRQRNKGACTHQLALLAQAMQKKGRMFLARQKKWVLPNRSSKVVRAQLIGLGASKATICMSFATSTSDESSHWRV